MIRLILRVLKLQITNRKKIEERVTESFQIFVN
jgi:hypothetical protein